MTVLITVIKKHTCNVTFMNVISKAVISKVVISKIVISEVFISKVFISIFEASNINRRLKATTLLNQLCS